MDILVSSNLERLLFEIGNRDPEFVKDAMGKLAKYGKYNIDTELLSDKFSFIKGFYSSEEETIDSIDNFFDMYDYLIDPHTAVGVSCFYKYLALDESETKTVIVSTANPYKFAQDVLYGILNKQEPNAFKAVEKLHYESGVDIPLAISELKEMEILHDKVINKEDIKQTILDLFR